MVMAAPMPAPKPLPDRTATLGGRPVCPSTGAGAAGWASSGPAVRAKTARATATRFSIFMVSVTPRLWLVAHVGLPTKKHTVGRSVLGVERHPHEQGGQEREDISLQEGDEQLQQAEGGHAD